VTDRQTDRQTDEWTVPRHAGAKYAELRCLENSLYSYITQMTFLGILCLITGEKAQKNLSQGKRNLSQVKKNLSQSTVICILYSD